MIRLIYIKELREIFRDRRTLFRLILLPMLLFPALFFLMGSLANNMVEKEMAEKVEQQRYIAWYGNGQGEDFKRRLARPLNTHLLENIPEDSLQAYIQRDSLMGAVSLVADFDSSLQKMEMAGITVRYHSSNSEEILDYVEKSLEDYKEQVLSARLDSLGLPLAFVEPFEVEESNYASMLEQGQKLFKDIAQNAGGFLPYIFIIFCFLGCMYPGIDLFTGEKERGTLETLLTTPASRLQILFGKMLTVSTVGLMSALLSILGLFIGMRYNGQPTLEAAAGDLLNYVEPQAFVILLLLLIPLSLFFSGIVTILATHAKTYKEAVSTITPLNIAVILPAALALIPGIELSLVTALVPILNISLATREVIAGTIDYGLLAVVFLSLVTLATLSVLLARRWFAREQNLFST